MKLDTNQIISVEYYDSYNFTFVNITIELKRRTLFYAFNFVLPGIFISILGIAGFLLPPSCGEKIGLRKISI